MISFVSGRHSFSNKAQLQRELFQFERMFQPLQPEHQNGPGIYYKVFWKRHNSSARFQFLDLKGHGNIGSTIVDVQTEFYYTQFDVKVQAINDLGKGPESSVQVIYSAEDLPMIAPQRLYSIAYNSTSLNVTWEPVEQSREMIRGKLIGHRVSFHS